MTLATATEVMNHLGGTPSGGDWSLYGQTVLNVTVLSKLAEADVRIYQVVGTSRMTSFLADPDPTVNTAPKWAEIALAGKNLLTILLGSTMKENYSIRTGELSVDKSGFGTLIQNQITRLSDEYVTWIKMLMRPVKVGPQGETSLTGAGIYVRNDSAGQTGPTGNPFTDG